MRLEMMTGQPLSTVQRCKHGKVRSHRANMIMVRSQRADTYLRYKSAQTSQISDEQE